MQKQSYYWAVAGLALLVGALAVTNQSLWIDEGSAALKAMEPSLGGWWHNLRSEGNSNLQLPGQLFYLWGWEKIFGASEISLRASNIPFFVGGVLALVWGMAPRRPQQNALALLALTNAFLCYYLSEARPYIVLFCFAAITAACLFRLLAQREEALASPLWHRLFCLGLVGLCLTSLIAVPWALGAIAAVLYWCGPRAVLRSAVRFRTASLLTLTALGGLGIYYLWTLQLGARASGVGRTGWSNIAYIFYELAGLAGLGPGRLQLRGNEAAGMIAFAPFIALGMLALLLLLLSSVAALKGRVEKRHLLFLLLAVALPFVLVLVAGAAGRMRLLGRHLTPLLPFLLAFFSLGLTRLLFAPTLWARWAGATGIAVLLASTIEIRVAPRHRRDDYRSAAASARQAAAAGESVWWLADVSTGRYYHVPLDGPHVTAAPEPPTTPPDVIIFSKPDVYDPTGVVRAYLARGNFKVERVLPAFQIWTRPPAR